MNKYHNFGKKLVVFFHKGFYESINEIYNYILYVLSSYSYVRKITTFTIKAPRAQSRNYRNKVRKNFYTYYCFFILFLRIVK